MASIDQGYANSLENWVNRMSDDERRKLFEVCENWKKEHPSCNSVCNHNVIHDPINWNTGSSSGI